MTQRAKKKTHEEAKKYTLGDLIKMADEERAKSRIIIEYLLNKNSHPLPRGVDYERFYEDMQDYEDSLRT